MNNYIKKTIISSIIICLSVGCLTMPTKKMNFNISQDENFQECRLMKIINECYILIQIKDKYYVSKLAGFSFDTKRCDSSWTYEQIRSMKISLLYDMIRWRSDNLNFYCLDVSEKNNNSEILMVDYGLSGYVELNQVTLGKSSAVYDVNYKGPYTEKLRQRSEDCKKYQHGFFGPFNEELYDRIVQDKFNLKNYPMEKPPVVGEWIPNEEQEKLLKEKYYERTGIKLN